MTLALVEAARHGDSAAFDALAAQHADRLMAIAFRILREVAGAEDAVQQALITAWRELPRLREPNRFEPWLRRLLVHACYAEARRRRPWSGRIRSIDGGGPQVAVVSGDDGLARVALRDELERAFLRLPADQRSVFVFHHYLGLTLGEIAGELGVPVGTVKSRLHYATAALRAAVEADARPGPAQERLA